MGLYSFRPLYTGLVSNMKNNDVLFETKSKFPSPIYGASFKLKIAMNTMKVISFRPLYTGLVSNKGRNNYVCTLVVSVPYIRG